MSDAYLEILDCRTDVFRVTGEGMMGRTDAETCASFDAARALDVGAERAEFTLDLHTSDDLVDTIGLDAEGFCRITGAPPKPPEHYAALDDFYWSEARRAADDSRPAPTWAEVKAAWASAPW